MKISKQDIFYTLKTALTLLLVCSVIAFLVAAVNYITAPVILQNDIDARNDAISELFGGECHCVEPDFDLEGYNAVTSLYDVYTKDDELLGYCAVLEPMGFKDVYNAVAAIDKNGVIIGIKVTSTGSETAGIGTRVAEDSFLSGFVGKGSNVRNEVDTISGATMSSRPLIEAVSQAVTAVKDYNGGTGNVK